jgi:hypothetical protein
MITMQQRVRGRTAAETAVLALKSSGVERLILARICYRSDVCLGRIADVRVGTGAGG